MPSIIWLWVPSPVSSLAQSCLTLCDPMDCSTPGFPVCLQLLELAQTHVHQVGDAIQPLILCCPLLLLPSVFPSIRVFSSVSSLYQVAKILVSALASVLPKNTQDWFPSEWLVGSPCSPRDSQESSPTPQFKSINSSALSFLHSPTLASIHDYWKNHSLD